MTTLFRWLAGRPLWLLHALGTVLGHLTYWGSPTYRRRFRENVRQAGIAPAAARPAIGAAGRMVAELPFLWLRPAGQAIQPPPIWHGEELVTAALTAGRGLVFLTPHLGSFEITAQAYAQRFAAQFGPVTVLYRPARKALLRELTDQARARPGLATAPATLAGVRQMMRALRRGEAIGLLPDQVPPSGMGVWAPFFDKPAYTMTLAARLAQQTGAALLLIWGERLPRGAGYTVRVSRLDEALPPASADENAQAESAAVVNRAMERLIRACPQQYLWGYNRYKAPRASGPAAP
jgi:KDO2-lipid IV(A) lauroyltransferase